MKNLFVKFVRNEKGINTVEVVVLIAVAIGIALIFRDKITDFITAIFDKIFNTDNIVPTISTKIAS